MRYGLRLFTMLLLVTPFAVRSAVAQEGKGVKTEAGILMMVNHYPNDAQKKQLQAIVDDKTSTASERTLATAMINMMHSVSAADKPKVEAIAKDPKATAGEKSLAEILGRFLHMASDADKATLKKLAA